MWRSVGKACGWKRPRAPSIRMLFRDDRATPAVPTFLRETKVGRMVNLAPLRRRGTGERTRERRKERRARLARPENAFFFCLSFVVYISFSFNRSYSFLGALGMEEKEKPHFDDRAPHSLVEDCRTGMGKGKGL